MKTFLKWLALTLVLMVACLALTASWYLSWDELPPPEMPGLVEDGVLEHDGRQREWLAYVPASKAADPALLIVLRGSNSDGAAARTGSFYSFDVLAERQGIVAVYPTGVDNHWNDCRASASYSANLKKVDDVGYLRALVREMSQRYGVDPDRVYATGLSNGGHMVYRLAFEAPDLLAGAAVLIANLPVPENSECEPAGEAVPMLIINGTEDAINPYEGGLVNLYGDVSRGAVQSARASVRYWANLAGYPGEGQLRKWPDSMPDDGTSIESLSWSEPGKVSVELITVVGGGHTFPNPVYNAPRILGTTSHEIDSAEVIWSFFERRQ